MTVILFPVTHAFATVLQPRPPAITMIKALFTTWQALLTPAPPRKQKPKSRNVVQQVRPVDSNLIGAREGPYELHTEASWAMGAEDWLSESETAWLLEVLTETS